MIVVLPTLVTLIALAVSFGLFHSRMQQVAFACRVGAMEAAELSSLPGSSADPFPHAVLEAIDEQLQSNGIPRCGVRLEHNLFGPPVVVEEPPSGACVCGSGATLSLVPSRTYVRVSIAVPKSAVMPGCLRWLGLAISEAGDVVGSSSVFRYERNP